MKYVFIILIALLSFSILEANKVWVLVKPHEKFETVKHIECFDSLDCYSLSSFTFHLVINHSSDKGKTWKKVIQRDFRKDGNLWSLLDVYWANSSTLYLTYLDRVVLEISENGREDFRLVEFGELSNDVNDYFDGLAILSDSISAGITDRNGETKKITLLHTFDNWLSYKKVTIPDSISASAPIFFRDSNNIVMARYDGYNTAFMNYNIIENSFSIWSEGKKVQKRNELISDLEFQNDSIGYLSGLRFLDSADLSNSLVWKSTDQGRNWFKLLDSLFEPGFGLQSIAFRNELNGIVVGNFGNILETTDGGNSWFQYPIDEDMMGFETGIVWAGSYPLFYSQGIGIFRLETVSEVEELSSNEKFKVYQSGDNLEIAINDPTHKKYIFELYSQTGQLLLTRSVGSAGGFLFEPVQLIDLSNGAYFYVITSNSGVEFSGKLVI